MVQETRNRYSCDPTTVKANKTRDSDRHARVTLLVQKTRDRSASTTRIGYGTRDLVRGAATTLLGYGTRGFPYNPNALRDE